MVSLVKQHPFPTSIVPLTSAEIKFFQFLEKHVTRDHLQSFFDNGKTKTFKAVKFGIKTITKIERLIENAPAYYAIWLYMMKAQSDSEIKSSCYHTETAIQVHALFMTITALAISAKSSKIILRVFKSLGARYASFVKEKIPAGGDLRALIFGQGDEQALTVRKLMSASYMVYAISCLVSKVIFNNGLTNFAIGLSKTSISVFKEMRHFIAISRGFTKLQNELKDRKKIASTTDEALRGKLIRKLDEKSAKQSFFYAKMVLHIGRLALNLSGTRLLHPVFALISARLNLGKSVQSRKAKQLKLEAKKQNAEEKESKVKVKEPKQIVAVNHQLAFNEFRRIFLLCAAIIFIAHAVFYKTERYNYCTI